MKRLFKLSIGVMIFFLMAGITTQLKAQVYGEFDTVRVVTTFYNQLDEANPNVVVLPRTDFALPPNFDVPDFDDGYKAIDIGFDFEFNGEVYNKLWININGFVTFGKKENNVVQYPPFLPPKDQDGLFLDANSYPVNVLAPFWGDHYYRGLEDLNARGFKPSKILYYSDGDQLIVEWRDLNINYKYDGKDLKNSIGNFQLRLIKSNDPYSKQGDIEFYYGNVGGNPYLGPTDDNRIQTKGATIGIKGEGKIVGNDADFLNAFINEIYLKANPNVPYSQVTKTKSYSNDWPPTTIKEAKFYFKAFKSFNLAEFWGDGDVDFSKAPGNKNYDFGYPKQNKYVTVNDARLIMRSVASEIPLDPIRRRAAYHGDVNHNGRYYYDVNSVRKNVTTKSKNYDEDLPSEVSSLKQILFEANEYDAALILAYIAAKVPELPWLLDTTVIKGKVPADLEKLDVTVKAINSLGNNLFEVPVYLNDDVQGPIGFKTKLNGDIIGVTANQDVFYTYNGSNLVVSGNSKFNTDEPIATVLVRTTDKNLEFTNTRLNDVNKMNKKYALVNDTEIKGLSVNTTQNPANSNNLQFVVNIPENGNYTLKVYDLFGKEVATVANGEYNQGTYIIDATANIATGSYFYRLEGNGNIATGKVIVK